MQTLHIDVKKSFIRGFWNYWITKSLLNYHESAKICRNVFLHLLAKRNLLPIPLILILKSSQWNSTLVGVYQPSNNE